MKPIEITDELAEKLGEGTVVTFVGPTGVPDVGDLSVLKTHDGAVPYMISLWELEDGDWEKLTLNPKAVILFKIMGSIQPPISMEVWEEESPEV